MLRISIIIPTYNSAATLVDCLESIIAQTYHDYEIIVMDGGSTDGTLNILKNYSSAIPGVTVVSEPDKGIYDAMNKAIVRAKGEWLYFIGSDDVLYSHEVFTNVLTKENLKYDIIYGNVILKHSKKLWLGKFNLYKLGQQNICHQAIFFKKKVFSMLGLYESSYRIFADHEFNFRWIANKGIKNKFIDRIIAVFNEFGLSGNRSEPAFTQNFQKIKQAAFERASAQCMIEYQINRIYYFIKRIFQKTFLRGKK